MDRLTVKDVNLVLPDGMSYSLMVPTSIDTSALNF